MTVRGPAFEYGGPSPRRRIFARVETERPRKFAASGARRNRPARLVSFVKGIMVFSGLGYRDTNEKRPRQPNQFRSSKPLSSSTRSYPSTTRRVLVTLGSVERPIWPVLRVVMLVSKQTKNVKGLSGISLPAFDNYGRAESLIIFSRSPLFMAAATCWAMRSAAARTGSSARCAYLCVVADWRCPKSLPIT